MHSKTWKLTLISLLISVLPIACAHPRELSKTPRTSIEQLLLGQAVERTLPKVEVPIPVGTPIALETTGIGPTYTPGSDLAFTHELVGKHLGELGLHIRSKYEATYLVKVLVEGLGTEQNTTFFGLPAIQSILLPIALPEITLFRSQRQKALARLSLHIMEVSTGRLIYSMPWVNTATFYHDYTVLLFINFRSTDLVLPP
jgi:hypothetical protein